jgi:hypothetical protein
VYWGFDRWRFAEGRLVSGDSADQEKGREGGEQIRPVTHGKIPDSPQNNTLLILGVALAAFGFKEMRIPGWRCFRAVGMSLFAIRFETGALLA